MSKIIGVDASSISGISGLGTGGSYDPVAETGEITYHLQPGEYGIKPVK